MSVRRSTTSTHLLPDCGLVRSCEEFSRNCWAPEPLHVVQSMTAPLLFEPPLQPAFSGRAGPSVPVPEGGQPVAGAVAAGREADGGQGEAVAVVPQGDAGHPAGQGAEFAPVVAPGQPDGPLRERETAARLVGRAVRTDDDRRERVDDDAGPVVLVQADELVVEGPALRPADERR